MCGAIVNHLALARSGKWDRDEDESWFAERRGVSKGDGQKQANSDDEPEQVKSSHWIALS